MRMSQLFGQTWRAAPADVESLSHQLLLRAGFVRPLAAGIFSYLPLGWRALRKIAQIMREEMDAIGGQEVAMPVVNPADIWQQTGRWYQVGSEMGRFQDKNGRDMALAMTHEEVVATLVRSEIQSHRQLPALIYHIQTKWRDDPRPRAGLIRAREFTMLDSYSLDADEAGLDRQYWAHFAAYERIFRRCGLETVAVTADVGMMGGSLSHEFMYLTPAGEDTLVICSACDYRANQQVARRAKPSADPALWLPLARVATPGAKTIADLAAFLGIARAQTAKALFQMATLPTEDGLGRREQLVFAVVRGDMELAPTKLANAVRALDLRPATDDEIRAVGAAPGYASPIGLDANRFLLVVDDAVAAAPNLAAGANEDGYHLLHTNYGRDYAGGLVADIAAAQAGDGCPLCGAPLTTQRGVEVGNIFKLGTRYTAALGATFTDAEGRAQPVVMGSYGIGVGRLLACIAEAHNDARGLCLPAAVAPYAVHLVQLRGGEEAAETLYAQLQAAGVETLLDDREATPGVKFNDADLIGLPLRLTVGARSLAAGGVEAKERRAAETRIIPLDGVTAWLIGR